MNKNDQMVTEEQRRFSIWQGTILVLSVYVLAALLLQTVCALPAEISRLLELADFVVCLVFAADFALQLRAAKRKWVYLATWGWIDLLSSIPGVLFLRIGRVARFVRILRLLRGIRSTRVLVAHLFENRARGTLVTVTLITFVLIVFSSIAVLTVETGPDASIRTAEDALWWALATVTTVGYGDVYPRTTVGHVVGAALMIAGIALFGTFTATVATFFVEQDRRREEEKSDAILRKLDALSNRLTEIEKNVKSQSAGGQAPGTSVRPS